MRKGTRAEVVQRRLRCPLCRELSIQLQVHTSECPIGLTLHQMAEAARVREVYARSLQGLMKKEVRNKVRRDREAERRDNGVKRKYGARPGGRVRTPLQKAARRKSAPGWLLDELLQKGA